MNSGDLIIRPIDIDLNLLRILLVLLETRSVTGAARKLAISQPAASRSLAQLRTAFQDPLLIRTNRGMELTRRGEELIEPLRDWLATTTSLFTLKDFAPRTLERTFRISSTDFGVFSTLSTLLRTFGEQAPNASIEIVPFDDTMIGRLGSGELDLVVTGRKPDFSATYGCHLFRESCSCLMRAGHPAWSDDGKALSLERFLEWPHISVVVGESGVDHISLFLAERDLQRNVMATLPYFQAVPHLVQDSDAIATLPNSLVRTFSADPRFVSMPAPTEIAEFDYWVLWHERSRRDPATLWVIDLLVAACAEMAD